MDKTIRIIAALLIVVALGGILFLAASTIPQNPVSGSTQASSIGNPTVYFFYGEECPHCHNIMPFIESLAGKYPDVNFQYLEIWHSQSNYAIYKTLNDEVGSKNSAVPEVIIGTTVLIGERDIPAQLESVIQEYQKKK
jgi:thiol-disulfide isomerase/thioredoxin